MRQVTKVTIGNRAYIYKKIYVGVIYNFFPYIEMLGNLVTASEKMSKPLILLALRGYQVNVTVMKYGNFL